MSRRWVIVGGGSGGIGSAICRALARDGWAVAATHRTNAAAAASLGHELTAQGHDFRALPVDLCDEGEVANAVAGLGSDLAGAVYAAGPPLLMDYVGRIPPDRFRAQLLGDAAACYTLFHAALPAVRASRGALLAVTTPAVERHAAKDVLSSAPKAAVTAVVKGIAAEEGRYGVRANCVACGLIEDGMWHALTASGAYTERVLASARASLALRRFGRAEDVADAAAFLMSDRAGWITGQTLAVDGGYAV